MRIHFRAKYRVRQLDFADFLSVQIDYIHNWHNLVSLSFDLLLRLARFLDENVLPRRTGNRSPHQQQVFVGIHLDHFPVLRGHFGVAHMAGKMLILPDARWDRTAADTARSAVKHRTVRGIAARVVSALHAASKTFTLADPTDIYQLTGFEPVHQHAVTD